jgi:hypothetical protein
MAELVFKLVSAPPIVEEVLEGMGWRAWDEKKDGEHTWHLKWQIQR